MEDKSDYGVDREEKRETVIMEDVHEVDPER